VTGLTAEDPVEPMKTNQTIKLIMTTYPGFQDLPKGVKQMLLVSESFFFDEASRQAKNAPALTSLPPPVTFVRPSTTDV
jgi:hypothetical protein